MRRTIAGALVVLASLAAIGAAPAAAKPKHHAPAACLRAITESESIAALNVRFTRDVQTYLTSIHDSAAAHAGTGDTLAFVRDLTTFTQSLGTSANLVDGWLAPHRSAFADAAATCRKGG